MLRSLVGSEMCIRDRLKASPASSTLRAYKVERKAKCTLQQENTRHRTFTYFQQHKCNPQVDQSAIWQCATWRISASCPVTFPNCNKELSSSVSELVFIYVMFIYLSTTELAEETVSVITDRVSEKGNAIGSVRLSVCPSVRLFPLQLLNRVTFNFDFDLLHVYGHSSPEIEGQGQRSKRDRCDLKRGQF